MNNQEKTLEKRSIIVVGKTGAGKSKFLNELLSEKQMFKSSPGIESCTNKIEISSSKVVKCKTLTKNNQQQVHDEISFELEAYDTPGIGDSKGRSREFLNDIAQTIKENYLNLIIILIEYQRIDTSLCNNLEILRECLNGLSHMTSMLIVNKVPTLDALQNKRNRGEEVPNRDEELKYTFEKLSELLGNSSFKLIFLENDDFNFEINEEKYNCIKSIIFSCSSRVDTSKVRTWNDIVKLYSKDISVLTDQEVNNQMEELILELKNKLDKIEFDIADVKYSFLDFLDYAQYLNDDEDSVDSLIFSNLKELSEFVLKFDCQLNKEEYFKRREVTSDYIEYFQNRILIFKTTAPSAVKGAAGLFSGISIYGLQAASRVISSFASAPSRAVNAAISTLTGSYVVGGGGTTAANLIGTSAASSSIAAMALGMGVFGAATLGLMGLVYFYNDKKNIDDKLNSLGAQRTQLKKELEKCQGSVKERKLMLEEKKAKISRLENALVNPNQIHA